jgi:hypothetical protein
MAKSLIKTLQTEKTPLKHAPNTPTEYNPLKKSRQQIYWENYQKNKERKKQQRRERYQQDKERIKVAQKQKYQQQKKLAQSQQKENFSKYYGAEAIKILMSFKDYIQINKEKQKL